MICSAGGSGIESRDALEQLCQQYWYPLYAWLRRKNHSHAESEDLTQGFFLHLLDRDRLQIADSGRGRFRSFLLGSLENFVTQQWRKETAQKRGGPVKPISLDFGDAETRYKYEPVDGETPERLFDRAWALEVLQLAIDQLRSEYESSGKAQLFDALKPHLVDNRIDPLVAIADQLKMSVGAVKVAAHRLRQKYRQRLRELVSQTVSQPDQIDDELAMLLAALS
jgi:RNA polymerase sigma factor (sigma-70 family)